MKKKRQHWVPKFYLNAFAIPETRNASEPRINALAMTGEISEMIQVATKNVANGAYLYSPVDEQGERDYTFENKLADLESTLSHLWSLLEKGCVPLTDGYRKGLALFVASLYLRHPRQQRIAHHNLEALHGAIEAHLETSSEYVEEFSFAHRKQVVNVSRHEYEEQKPKCDNDYHRFFVDSVDGGTGEIAKLLLNKRWNVIVSDSHNFITSDNPVCVTGPRDRSFGIATPGVSVNIPLTPDKYLVIDDNPGPCDRYVQIFNAKGDVTSPEAAFNFRTTGNAYRFIFGPKNLYNVLEEGLKFCDNIHNSDTESPYYALRSPEDGRLLRLGRNEPCWCESGKKYKHCHQPFERMIERDRESLMNFKRERVDLELP